MSGNHVGTRDHNIELLICDLKLQQYGNTTIFYRDSLVILSPAVAKNTQNYYWFDIREANIRRIEEMELKLEYLLLRIVPDRFILCSFEYIKTILTEPKIEKAGTKKWEFIIGGELSTIKNRNAKNDILSVKPSTKEQIIKQLGL